MKRACGDCQLCCTLLPVREIGKVGGKRCDHQQFGKGCRVYTELFRVSPSCVLWSCEWLIGGAETSRPDRAHYVIDMMPDYVQVTDNESGERTSIPAVQVWVDPKYPDAHKDKALRAYLLQRAERDGACAIIRLGPRDGFVLFAPPLTGGRWHEQRGTQVDRKQLEENR